MNMFLKWNTIDEMEKENCNKKSENEWKEFNYNFDQILQILSNQNDLY